VAHIAIDLITITGLRDRIGCAHDRIATFPGPREKLVGKSWVHNPFSTRVNHMEIELERDLSVKC
jgi:hypothetical protein